MTRVGVAAPDPAVGPDSARRAGTPVNGPLLRHTWRSHRWRVALIAVSLGVWSYLMPVIYATFGRQLEALIESGIIPEVFLRFLGSTAFSLNGGVALGVVHPFAIALQAVYPVGFAASAIAGERQRGTLEVLLSRPVSRRAVHLTYLVAIVAITMLTTTATLVGTILGAAAYGVAGDLAISTFPFLWLNTVLLYSALGAVALAVSASSDRLTPALGLSVAILLVGYVLEVLGTLWPDAEPLQPVSLMHYLQPLDILAGHERPADLLVLAVVLVGGVAYARFRFPRRDLAAPT